MMHTENSTARSIDYEDAGYPVRLKELGDAPKKIYYRGDVSLLGNRCVAVVGSRKYSENGRKTAFDVSKAAAAAGLTVVSGMARGIDTAAHEGALAAGGKTIAVLGTGVDICYPAANRQLKERIEHEGLVISELAPGIPASRATFPRRNRIISGISEAVVVCEAGLNSGALITAGLAEEQGRYVYAVPSGIYNKCALGSNMLIRDGAMPLVVIDDLLHDLGVAASSEDKDLSDMGEDEKKVYEALLGGGERTVDEICRQTFLAPEAVNGIVTVMEMKGIVWTALGKIFLAK